MQKYANLVELEKCCRTHIFLQNFVLIQPRTSPPKICKILQKNLHLLVAEVEDDEDDGDDVLDEVLPVAVPSEDAQELIAGVLDVLLGEGPRKARNLRLF